MVEPVELHRNRHPVEEMHDLKEEIDRLQRRYDQLRNHVIAVPGLRVGEEYKATVREYPDRRRLDIKAVRRFFGNERLERFMVSSPFTTVWLSKKK